ncbi:MAG: hypothetical protein F6K58_00235 [Symploca sp. SIO2E9]|nr:hypothetical protein [Symploca sp. SIO2E9]
MGRWGDEFSAFCLLPSASCLSWGEREKILEVIFPSKLDNLFLGVPLE